MFYLNRLIIALIAICVIVLPISFLTIAAEDTTPTCDVCTSGCSACPRVTVETSYGVTMIITNRDRAHQEWNTHEDYLRDAINGMEELKAQRDAINKAIAGDRSSLQDMLTNLGVLAAAGKRPDIGATVLFVQDLRKIVDITTSTD